MLDVSMQFHTCPLDEESQACCAIATPFGKCECLRLPMGFLNSPSWAQAAVDELFLDMTNVEVCVDEIRMFSTDCDDHIETAGTVFHQLEQHNFTIKAAKCHWCQLQALWLGHIITSTGVLPNPDKTKPILQSNFPKTVTELQSFVGMINLHRSFWK